MTVATSGLDNGMTAHTSGPWVVLVDDDTGRPLEIVLERDHNKRVAFPTSDGPIEDAFLIAAAPDLLAALVCITDQLERVGDTREHKDGQFIDADRAAIAKAQGRAP